MGTPLRQISGATVDGGGGVQDPPPHPPQVYLDDCADATVFGLRAGGRRRGRLLSVVVRCVPRVGGVPRMG